MQHIKTNSVQIETEAEDQQRQAKVRIFKWQAKTALACLLARAVLIYYYVKCMFRAQAATAMSIVSANNFAALGFLFMEIAFSLYRLVPQHLEAIKFGPKARYRPGLRVVGDDVPTIDVLIFYCGEELDVLLDTIRAACSVNYPRERFRVTVLDDSASVLKHVQALTVQFPNLFYSTRGAREPSWHKAGNINHGLRFIASLPNGPSEFVAGLDVDMIPEPDWLRRVVPHLLQDSQMGLVSPNQRFYNVPRGDPLGQVLQFDQLLMVRTMRRDFGGMGLGGGTGWLARRAAIDSLGGFSTDSTAEDFLTCVDLRDAGWKVALLDEYLQWGLTPDSFNGYTKQIQRWTTAMLSYYKALSGSTVRPRRHRVQKFLAEASIVSYFIAITLCYFGLPLAVLSGQPLVRHTSHDELRALITLASLDFLAQSTHGFLESWTADFNIHCWHEPSHLWQASLYLPPAIRAWFPFLSHTLSGTLSSALPGNSAANRSTEDAYRSPWRRLKVLLTECHLWPHIFVLSSCVAGLAVLLRDLSNHLPLLLLDNHGGGGGGGGFTHIITRAGWPPALFLWTSVLSNALKPFRYALCVPRREEREAYLVRDQRSRVAYPTARGRDQTHRRVGEGRLGAALVYMAGVGVGVWCALRG